MVRLACVVVSGGVALSKVLEYPSARVAAVARPNTFQYVYIGNERV